jgi:hypothetical protein
VRVRHFFEEDGRLVLVMDLCEGESLAQLLRREGRLTERRAAAAAVQVLEALDAVHWDGIVHRDLKPANIMICRDPDADDGAGADQVKILDFGLARIVGDRNLTLADTMPSTIGGVVGTVTYMSPEQIRAAPDVDLRSDLFAVGIILYEMLAGSYPFQGDTPLAAALSIVESEPAALPASGPNGVQPAIAAVIFRALAKDRDARFQTAEEFADALRGALEGRTPAAPNVRPERGAPRVRRGFLVAAGATGLLVVAASTLAGPTDGAGSRRPDDARRDARPSSASRLARARAALDADPWAARDAARSIESLPDTEATLAERSTAAIVEGEAVRRIRTRAVVRDPSDLETLPDQAFARAYRLGAGSDVEVAALARLGEEIESEGRSKGACAILGLLHHSFPDSPEASRTRVAFARAELSAGRFDEARQILGRIDAEGPRSSAAAAVARLLEDLSPVTAFDTSLADVLCAADLDGDGRAELVGFDAAHGLVAMSFVDGALSVRASAALPGGEPTSACAFRPSANGPVLVAVAIGPAREDDRVGAVETFELRGGAFVRRGAPAPVRQDARLFPLDLFGDGRTEILVCHAACPERSVTLLEFDESAGALVERPCELAFPAGVGPGAVDVFGAARLSDGRVVLATGYPRMLGAAMCSVEPGAPVRLRVEQSKRDANVESVAADGDGGAAYTVSHIECGHAGVLGLQRDAHAPGIRRMRFAGADAPLYEVMRTLAVVGDGAVHATGEARHFGISIWRRGGSRRWITTREFGGDEHPSGSLLCIDDAPGAAPFWLRFLPWSPTSHASMLAADLDGDGLDELVAFDPATHRVWTAGLAATGLRGTPLAPLEIPEMHASQAGGSRLPDAADNLSLVGFNEEAVRAFEELIARSGEGTLVAESLHEAVAGNTQLGRFERAHSLLDAYERRQGGRGRANRPRLLVWRALVWEAQGRLAEALECAREAAASVGAGESDRGAAAGVVQRLDPFVPAGHASDDAPSLRGAASLAPGMRRADLVPPVDAPGGAFTLTCGIRFSSLKPGGGLAVGLQGDAESPAQSPLGAQMRLPFEGMFLSIPRIAPHNVGLGVFASGRAADWSLATLPLEPVEPADALTWYRLEVNILPFAGIKGVASMRLWRDGRDERLFERLTQFPLAPSGARKIGVWLFRHDDEPVDTAGLCAEVRDLRIVTYPRQSR